MLLVAALIYLPPVFSPPHLMDDVDAVQAQIARNMLESGDWVTPRLNGVVYLEKAPLPYWLMAACFAVFGVHDWAARLPLAVAIIALCWVTCRIGQWALSAAVGSFAGLALASSVGLFLFTRILIPDCMLTLCITLALWFFLRLLEDSRRLWAHALAVTLAAAVLLKGLIGLLFPLAAAGLYVLLARPLTWSQLWRRLHVPSSATLFLLLAAPWHLLATLRNPPYLDFTMRSEPGQYHGFFWFYFLNEHLFRFLNMRHPRDYNTVPRLWFWVLHLVWLFPFSAFLHGLAKLNYRPVDLAGRVRVLALCWIGFVLLFFSFSTTQEYYSLPIYPALALLLGSALADNHPWLRWGWRTLTALCALCASACAVLWLAVRDLPTPGDISQALTQHPEAYTLSLGHMGDLTVHSFAYLRLPLLLAALALTLGCWAGVRRSPCTLASMMVVFFTAARLAMVTFDPYLSSYPLAEALKRTPPGRLIVDNQYYAFSSVFFYAHERARGALLLNGRVNNLEYGSYAPGAPAVFMTDAELPSLWSSPQRVYLLAERPRVEQLRRLTNGALFLVAQAGGKFLFTNHALSD